VQWRTQSGPLCAVICGDDFLTSALAAAGKRAREGERERQTQTERPREREREREGGWEGEGEGGRGSRESRQPLRRGDTAKLSERQRVKGRLPIYLRRLPRIRRGVLFHAQATLSSSRGAANAAESERLFLIS